MRLEQITLYHIAMPLVEPFATSFGVEKDRECIIVQLDAQGLTGWGEMPVARSPGYSYETVGTAWHVSQDYLVPAILNRELASPRDMSAAFRTVKGHRMAKAGFQAALWDLLARAEGKSLQQAFGGSGDRVRVGVSVGLQPAPQALVERVRAYLEDGYRRVKIKIKPGRDVEDAFVVRQAFPELMLQVDANSAYRLDDSDAIRALDDFDLLLIEQPFAEDDILDHAKLQPQLKTSLCLDESIVSPDHARWALESGACRVVNIKPARVGGFWEAIQIHDLCRERGVPVWCGGMLETGIGRAGNLALASLPNFQLPGDISATARYYHEDIVDAEFILNEDSTIDVPQGRGLGVEVDADRLMKVSVRRDAFRSDAKAAIGFSRHLTRNS